jgi:hypothetical protein
MDTATFTHSKFQRAGALAGCIVVALFFTPMVLLGLWFLTSSVLSGEKVALEDRLAHIGGFGVMAWMLFWLSQHFRYRHAYRATYVLGGQGVHVTSPNQQIQIGWHEFDRAEYFPLLFLARLTSSKVSKPVVLFLTTENKDAVARSEFARNLIEETMGSRFKKRWL